MSEVMTHIGRLMQLGGIIWLMFLLDSMGMSLIKSFLITGGISFLLIMGDYIETYGETR